MTRLRRAADQAASWEVIPRPQADASFQSACQRSSPDAQATGNQTCRPIAGGDAKRSAACRRGGPRCLSLQRGIACSGPQSAMSPISGRNWPAFRVLSSSARHDEPRSCSPRSHLSRAVDGTFSAPTFQRVHPGRAGARTAQCRRIVEHRHISQIRLAGIDPGRWREICSARRGADSVPRLLAHIKSLQSISNADWVYLIEPLIVFDEFLRQDPAGVL